MGANVITCDPRSTSASIEMIMPSVAPQVMTMLRSGSAAMPLKRSSLAATARRNTGAPHGSVY